LSPCLSQLRKRHEGQALGAAALFPQHPDC
jgi:hypothetical protein